MCDVMVASSIVEVLEAKVQNGDIFTVFDVTQEVRKALGRGNNVSHNDVRNIIGNEFRTGQMQGYERDLCTLELPNSPQAFVYYPDNKEASNYHLVADGDTNGGDGTVIDDDDDDDVVKMTAAGRIDIPQKALHQITNQGGAFSFSVGGQILRTNPDKNGRIRFSLNRLGIKGAKAKLIVDVARNKIDIESV